MLVGRRWTVLAPLLPPAFAVMNVVCAGLDAMSTPVHRRWPHSLVLVARRPVHSTGRSPRRGAGDQSANETM
jgi:hypothetical protein